MNRQITLYLFHQVLKITTHTLWGDEIA